MLELEGHSMTKWGRDKKKVQYLNEKGKFDHSQQRHDLRTEERSLTLL